MERSPQFLQPVNDFPLVGKKLSSAYIPAFWLLTNGLSLRLCGAGVLLFTLASVPLWAAESTTDTPMLSVEQVRHMLSDYSKIPTRLAIQEDHPDHPAYQVLQALRFEKQGKTDEVIRVLEPILVKTFYKGVIERPSKVRAKIWVSTIGSFTIWREAAYLLLGRAYYRKERYGTAKNYLAGVPDSSLLAIDARLAKGWTLLANSDWEQFEENAEDTLELLEDQASAKSSSQVHEQEVRLQQAFFLLKTGEYEDAATLAKKIQLQPSHSPELEALRVKVIVQSEFNRYFAQASSMEFNEKVAKLESLSKLIAETAPEFRDPPVSFLAAEIHWQLASLFRMENAKTHESKWKAALGSADAWLGPWVKKSVQSGQNFLEEEAFFLAIAILWEQGKRSDAVPRLKALPKLFPNGQYVETSYQLLADYHYEIAQYETAIHYYSELAKIGSEERSAYGIFRAAQAFDQMNKKWEALRHYERLYLFFRKKFPEEEDFPKVGLVKETEDKMILVMAQLLPSVRSLPELNLFQFKEPKATEVREHLAQTYKGMNRHLDAMRVWRGLLETRLSGNKTVVPYHWFEETLTELMAGGLRKDIASYIDQFYPKLPTEVEPTDALLPARESLEKRVGQLLLVNDEQSRRGKSPRLWNITDDIYTAWLKHFPQSKNGEVWERGAQRNESVGKKWEAVEWYIRSGNSMNYAGRTNSALSALRIVESFGEGERKKVTQNRKIHLQIVDSSKWFIDHFNDNPQRSMAERLYVESLFQLSKYDDAHKYIVGAFQDEGATKNLETLYLEHHERLKSKKIWDRDYQLATDILSSLDKRGEDKKANAFVRKINSHQITAAFLAADQNLATGKKPDARTWYSNAIEASKRFKDTNVALKGWSRRLDTWNFPEEYLNFISDYVQFEAQLREPLSLEDLGKIALTKQQEAFLYPIYKRLAEAWRLKIDPINRADALAKMVETAPSTVSVQDELWEIATTYGAYGDLSRMKRELRKLTAAYPSYLNLKERRLKIARLMFHNKKYKEAWSRLENHLGVDVPVEAWVLLVDLFNQTEEASPKVYREVQGFLKRNKKRFEEVRILQPLWAELFAKRTVVTAEWASPIQKAERTPASKPQFLLESRQKNVKAVLERRDQGRKLFVDYLSSDYPRVRANGFCEVLHLNQEVEKDLSSLKEPAIEDANNVETTNGWKALSEQIDFELREVRSAIQSQQKECSDLSTQIVYMPLFPKRRNAFCSESDCFPIKAEFGDIREVELSEEMEEVENGKPTAKLVHLIFEYIKIGAWGAAEMRANLARKQSHRDLLVGMIRLAAGDPWGALPYLESAKADGETRHHAYLLLARMAWVNGNQKIYESNKEQIDKDYLLAWQKRWLEEMDEQPARGRL